MPRSPYLEVETLDEMAYREMWREACPGAVWPSLTLAGRMGREIHGATADLVRLTAVLDREGVAYVRNNFRS